MDPTKQAQDKTKLVYEELNKIPSYSLKNKLLYIQRLNEERTKLQEDTYEVEYLELKSKYEIQYQQCYDEISAITLGAQKVNLTAEDLNTYKLQNTSESENGIPNYWATVLTNASRFVNLNVNDVKIIQYLTDIRVVNKEDKLSFTMEFHFAPNEYFTNQVLFKTFVFDVKDHNVHKVEKSGVDWKSEDKIPNKVSKAKTVKKGKTIETTTTQENVESFFDMFIPSPNDNSEEENQMNQEEGEFWKDDLIPFSVEYYLNIVESQYFEGEHESE